MRGLGFTAVFLVGSAFAFSPVPEWVELPLTLLEDEQRRAPTVEPSPRASPQSLPYLDTEEMWRAASVRPSPRASPRSLPYLDAEKALSLIGYHLLLQLGFASPSPLEDGSNNHGHRFRADPPRLGAYPYDDYGEEVPEKGEKGDWMSMHILEWF